MSMNSLIARTDPSSYRWSFDVFLSFRGEDTRFNFVSHLDLALRQKGINVFIDYILPKGGEICSFLLKNIEDSRISIVVISENYASSSWCLDELVKIMEGKKCNRQEVFPVFYKVDPSDVRKQRGSFGEALAKHQINRSLNQIQAWREALIAISNLNAWVLQNHQNEANLIQDILQKVLNELNRTTPLDVAKCPVGIDSQIKDMNLLSAIMSDGNTMIGIYGIGGMGKTTLATALFNKIANQFEGCSFLENVREASKQFNGLIQLQEMLLSKILMCDLIKISSLREGVNIIKDRLRSKKILLVLDNVDTSQQLEVLAGGNDWFGKGSKIIVTTRNKQLLSIHNFDVQLPMQELSKNKAIELFSWHAFKKSCPSSEFLKHSIRAVDYCKGLPLALVVLGSFFCGRDESTWERTLSEYERKISLDKGIQDILQISYDGLDSQTQQIFLHISCLLVGKHIDDAKMLLEESGLCSEKGIANLMDQSLLTINGKIEMHDLIQEMGCIIASSESVNPRKRKYLLTKCDVEDVLNDNKEARAVKAIKLNFDEPTKLELDIDAPGFENLKNLTFIEFHNVTFSGDVEYLPNRLKWIDWSNFPFSSFPSNYSAKNLFELRLQRSSIKDLTTGFTNCGWLKSVDLSRSRLLKEIPDFCSALNLEKLNLEWCTNLVEIHDSVGSLGKLVTLNLEMCKNLRQLPNYLKLRSLHTLNLRYCRKLENFPHIGEEMKSSRCVFFKLSYSGIRELPPSIEYLTGLRHLYLRNCPNLKSLPNTIYCLTSLLSLDLQNNTSFCTLPFSFPSPPSLTSLDLNSCNLSDVSFLEHLSYAAPSLLHLDLSYNNFFSLPSCIHNFTSLSQLVVCDCKLLEEIPIIPEAVELVDARGCISLATFPNNIIDFISYQPKKKKRQDDRESFLNFSWRYRHNMDADVDYCDECAKEAYIKIRIGRFLQIHRSLILMNYNIPEWYNYKEEKNNSVTFVLPLHQTRKMKALAACVVFQFNCPTYDEFMLMNCVVYINDTLVFIERLECPWRSEYESQNEFTWLLVFNPKSPMSFNDELLNSCSDVDENDELLSSGSDVDENDQLLSSGSDIDEKDQLLSSGSTDHLRNDCVKIEVLFSEANKCGHNISLNECGDISSEDSKDWEDNWVFPLDREPINYKSCGAHVVYENDDE